MKIGAVSRQRLDGLELGGEGVSTFQLRAKLS
jgi:hypothetical protein